jgi:hypothetical protein
LYLDRGKRSFTSSIVISFFSRLRRCGLAGMLSRIIGSTSSPFRRARLRALYRKQYLTPTIILRGSAKLEGAQARRLRTRDS